VNDPESETILYADEVARRGQVRAEKGGLWSSGGAGSARGRRGEHHARAGEVRRRRVLGNPNSNPRERCMAACRLSQWDARSACEPLIRVGVVLPSDGMAMLRRTCPASPICWNGWTTCRAVCRGFAGTAGGRRGGRAAGFRGYERAGKSDPLVAVDRRRRRRVRACACTRW